MDGGAVEESSQPAENNDPPDEEQEAAVVEVDPTGRYSRFAQILGRGAFKTVYKGFDEQEGIEIAWNQVRVSELVSSREERDRLFAEIRVLKQLKHKNIMTFHDSWLDQSTYSVNFITELFTSGTLRQYRKRHKHIDSEVLKSWAWQILCGLVYLHGHTPPIIHRDLKCDNIFINGGEGVVKIGDLGLATLLRARTAPQSVLGTPEFMAPELYDEDYDDRVDVYSFGMCLLELATLEYPYCECRNAAQIYRKVTLGVRPSSLQKVPEPALAEFINLCIQQRETRPRARQLLKHPYFDSIRQERCNAKLQAEALASTGEANPMAADFGDLGSSSTGTSRSSSAGEGELVQHVEHVRQFQPPLLPHQILEEPSPPPSQHSSPPVSQHNSPRGMSPMQPQQQPEQPQQQVLRPESHHGGGMSSRPGSAVTAGLSDTVMSPRSDVLTVTDHGSNNGDAPTTTSAQQQYLGLAVDQAAASAAMAESLVSMAEVLSEGGGSFFSEAPGGTVVDSMVTADRQFKVKGKLQTDQEKLNLRLRIFEPSGPSKTVEFDFDLAADTAMSVASEMVEDLSLSHEDARAIASAIKNEVQTLTGISPPLPDRDCDSSDGHQHSDSHMSPVEHPHDAAAYAAAANARSASPVMMHHAEAGPAVNLQPQSSYSSAQCSDSVMSVHDDLPEVHAVHEQPAYRPARFFVEASGPPVRSPGSPSPSVASIATAPPILNRNDSAIMHGAVTEAVQHTTGQKRTLQLLSPPREEDRRLPLLKLFEHLQPGLAPEPEPQPLVGSMKAHSQPVGAVAAAAAQAAVQQQQQQQQHLPLAPLVVGLGSCRTSPRQQQSVSSPNARSPLSLAHQPQQIHQLLQRHSYDNPATETVRPRSTGRHTPTRLPGLTPRSSSFDTLLQVEQPLTRRMTADQLLGKPGAGASYMAARAISGDDMHPHGSHGHLSLHSSRPSSPTASADMPLSAPASKLPSRDASPMRDSSMPLSPTGGSMGSGYPSGQQPADLAMLPGTACLLQPSGTGMPNLARHSAAAASCVMDAAQKAELRRKQASDAMKNMEFKSLEGLNSFSLARGCKRNDKPPQKTPMLAPASQRHTIT